MAAVWLARGLALCPMLVLALTQSQEVASSKQSQLWLDCPCLHVSERNSTQWGKLSVNASQAFGSKNNCLMIFIGGQPDELVAFQLVELQLRSSCCKVVLIWETAVRQPSKNILSISYRRGNAELAELPNAE